MDKNRKEECRIDTEQLGKSIQNRLINSMTYSGDADTYDDEVVREIIKELLDEIDNLSTVSSKQEENKVSTKYNFEVLFDTSELREFVNKANKKDFEIISLAKGNGNFTVLYKEKI